MKWLIKTFCYCGVSKEEYDSIKKDAYISNFRIWKYLHLLIVIVFAIIMVESYVNYGFSFDTIIEIMMLIYSVIFSYLFLKKIREDSIVGQIIIYLTMVLLLFTCSCFGIKTPNMPAFSFVIMLVLASMFMIDRPFFMTITLVFEAVSYLILAKIYKDPTIYRKDHINVVTYTLLGIIINVFL